MNGGSSEISRVAAGQRQTSEVLAELNIAGRWARFGDELAVVDESAERTSVDHRKPYVVVQKGRLFQKENPEVPIVVDKGRYLLVELNAAERSRIVEHHGPCFSISPLETSSVVFEHASPSASRTVAMPWIQEIVDGLQMSKVQATIQNLVGFARDFPRVRIIAKPLIGVTISCNRWATRRFASPSPLEWRPPRT